MSEISAVNIVVNFIIEQDLYAFSALSDSVQNRLTTTFGFGFISKVNKRLAMCR